MTKEFRVVTEFEMDELHTVDDVFMTMRLNVDVCGTVGKQELAEFARAWVRDHPDRADIIELATMSAEAFAAFVNGHGGAYPLEELRASWHRGNLDA